MADFVWQKMKQTKKTVKTNKNSKQLDQPWVAFDPFSLSLVICQTFLSLSVSLEDQTYLLQSCKRSTPFFLPVSKKVIHTLCMP